MEERICIKQGDITQEAVDAIVNAANTSLLGGGGVDGAIHRAAGPALLEACKGLNGCRTGGAKITKGYKLPAKWVIHTVGPVWGGGARKEGENLANCYRCSLDLAIQNKLQTIAFPSISTGAYRFPLDLASKIAIHEVQAVLKKTLLIKEVRFVCFDEKTFKAYSDALQEVS